MKRWPWIIAVLYALLLVVIAIPLVVSAIQPAMGISIPETLLKFFRQWQYWLWLGIMLIAQAIFLRAPVDIAQKRPMSKRTVLLPIVTAGFAAGLLAVGVLFCIGETVMQTQLYTDKNTNFLLWISLGTLIFVWAVWAALFLRRAQHIEPATNIERQCRNLFRGSVLELLIAVPTHIVARYRDYCCAGFATFVGITFGIAVMLFSFGPGIVFLYRERWKKLHPR